MPKREPKLKVKGAGNGGTVPPAEKRFKPGPDPRRGKGDTAGAILKNCINALYRRNVRDSTLRRIIKDPKKPSHVRQAAEIYLHSRRATTIADFEPWLKGKKSLKQLEQSGVDVSLVKSARIDTRGRRTLQLFDRVHDYLLLILEQTDGRPKQTTEVKFDGVLRTPADRELAAAEATDRLRKICSPSGN